MRKPLLISLTATLSLAAMMAAGFHADRQFAAQDRADAEIIAQRHAEAR